MKDVTDLRAVTAQPDEMASIVQVATDLAWIGLPDRRLRWMNPAGRALLSFDATELR